MVSESVENQIRSPAMLYRLGLDLLGIAAEHPTEFLDVVKTIEECERLTALKSKKAQDVEASTSSSATHSDSHRLTVFKDLGLDDRHQEAENGSTATDADSVGASGSTADRSSKEIKAGKLSRPHEALCLIA